MMYSVKAFVDVYEDSYEQGELRNANFWTDDSEFEATDKVDAIGKMVEKMYYGFIEKDLYEDDGIYRYGVMVDEDNCEASVAEINQWKLGNMTLYSANIEFKVYQMVEV